jgi:RNA polymerase sigma factor (sigma-70 family)
MNVHFSYKVPKNPSIEKEINLHVEKLGRRLQVFRPELIHLRGVIEENSAPQGFVVSLDLRLPSGDLAARENGPGHAIAIKAVFDELMDQVSRHKGQLRNEYRWIRRGKFSRQRPEAQVPFEETLAAVQPVLVSSQDIASYVTGNLPRLRSFVVRELHYRENLGQLPSGHINPEEVIDEAIANALGEDSGRPERLALEPWLYRLSLRAIEDLARPPEDQDVSVPPSPTSGIPDRMPRVERIPDSQRATPEDSAASEEILALVEAALLGAKTQDREAFLLYAVQGFTEEEISAIFDRSIQEVQRSIAGAREHLRTAVSVPREFKDRFLH